MEVKVKNKYGLVRNAFIKENEYSFSLFINTHKKHIYPNSRHYSKKCLIYYFNETDNHVSNRDMVELIAENEHDEEVIKRVIFECHDKNQLWYLFVKDEIWN